MLNKYAIVDTLTNKIHVTSSSEKIIKGIYETGFKTKWHTFKIVKI